MYRLGSSDSKETDWRIVKSTSNTDEIRSLRVEGLLPRMDAKYLYGCFSDHGQVVAATVLHNVRTGFVEFTSRSWAEMILKSYNGLGMPNFNQIYRLKWDMDAAGMMWRWDYAYERCSYFGFNDAGEELNANRALLRYKHLIPAVNEKPAAAAGQQHQEGASELTYERVERIYERVERIRYEEWCKERFLYLCMEELCAEIDGCYVIRTLKLSNLLLCSCKFDEKIGNIITCRHCADCSVPFELQKQAWLCTKDFRNKKSPTYMGCASCYGVIMFAGGLNQSPDQTRAPYFVPSQECYIFLLRNDRNGPCLVRRPSYLIRGKPEALLVNVDGSLYCLSGLVIGQDVVHPTFEVYSPHSGIWVPLPDPPFYTPEALNYKRGDPRAGTHLSYAIIGTKLLVSSKIPGTSSCPHFPVCCFDVKEQKWTEVTTLFNGKPFPFRHGALVVDLEDGTHDKVMFYFNNYFAIRACRLVVNEDDGSIKNSPPQSLGIDSLMTSLLEITIQNQSMVRMSWDFVDLGNKKVCFVLSSSLPKVRDDYSATHRQTIRLLVLVIQFQVLESGDFSFKFLATRTFEYQGHFPFICHPRLQRCFLL